MSPSSLMSKRTRRTTSGVRLRELGGMQAGQKLQWSAAAARPPACPPGHHPPARQLLSLASRPCAGGYHRVRVGEKFKDGRYTVLHKLGWGHFSTVWMVHDEVTGQQAAMKVRAHESS